MPYELITVDGKHCVRKQGEQDPLAGGCHESEQDAKDHMAALYAAEEKSLPDLTDLASMFIRAFIAQKAGQRHNAGDQRMLNSMHDMCVDLGAGCPGAEKAERYGGKPRGKLQASDFVDSENRVFPVMTAADVSDAVSSWGRYTGPLSFEQFKAKLIALAKRKGLSDALPKEWRDELEKAKHIAFGGEVKAIGPGKLRGTGVVFGGSDLQGDEFTRETDLGRDRTFIGMPVYYDHGLSGVKSQIGHVSAYEFTDDGLDFEIELDKRKSYLSTIEKLVSEKALGLSTAAMPHLVVREDGMLKRWIVGELSLTPTPAEPRTAVHYVKFIIDEQPQLASLTDAVVLLE